MARIDNTEAGCRWSHSELESDPGRVMLLDRLEWHGAPLLDLWPRVSGGVPSYTEQADPQL